MEGRQLRDRDAIALDLVGVVGLAAFLLALSWLGPSKQLGFDASDAASGILGQLSVTLPAALLVVGATALELAAGLVLARAARRSPFDSIADALLAAMVAAVLKDTLLLGILGATGLFIAPVLLAVNLAVVLVALRLPRVKGLVLPLMSFATWREHTGGRGSWTLTALVLVVWTGPVLLQLASPVVPFIDVLPNYVGPVEHLRTFGWLSPLTATQSPIIGPSRQVLGYDALLGAIATETGLPGGLAIAGFILPQTILVAAGAYRLASAIRGGNGSLWIWALLAFALSQPFARLADARGTVVVVPLVCLGLAVAAEVLRGQDDARTGEPWRIGRGAVIGLAIGAAILVHPVIGFFAMVTIGIAGLARPARLAPDAAVAALTAGLIAVPQLATMIGVSLPTIALGAMLPIAVAIGIVAGRAVLTTETLRAALTGLARLAGIAVVAAAVLIVAWAFAADMIDVDHVMTAIDEAWTVTIESSGFLLFVIATGAVLGSRGARSPLVLAGIGVGFVVVAVTQVLPAGLGFLGDALRFEVPKTVHYWTSAIAAAGAAVAIADLASGRTGKLPLPAKAIALVAFVVIAALPLRFGNSGDDDKCKTDCAAINAFHLGEHRWSETFAIDLRFAASGFWVGFPDARRVVDRPRQELLDAVRAEIRARRLDHDTPVLHVAWSFQQWESTPLGVFDGVLETSVSEKPEVGHQTVGGRLYGYDRLPELLTSHAYPYLVLEPHRVPAELHEDILAAGYTVIYANDQGQVFRLG